MASAHIADAEPPARSWEPSELDIATSMRELAEKAPSDDTDPLDAIVALFDKWDTWDTWESARVSVEQDYALSNELQLERPALARQHAVAKFRRSAVEARLATLLQQLSPDDREAALTKSFVWSLPGVVKVVVCKPALRKRLRQLVAHANGR